MVVVTMRTLGLCNLGPWDHALPSWLLSSPSDPPVQLPWRVTSACPEPWSSPGPSLCALLTARRPVA